MTPRPHDLVVGPWGARFLGRRFPCSIGRGGARFVKREGDLATPIGRWALRGLYWRADRAAQPLTGMSSSPLGPQQGWAEDPVDPAYNRAICHPHPFPADRMFRGDPLYDICVFTDHNAACVPGAGSAIFVHLWRRPRWPTAGCVALRRVDLEWILERWDPRGRLIVRPCGGLF
ncbi:MAG: L,D-transpeptidase family protein [Pseudomonadota bacterium]